MVRVSKGSLPKPVSWFDLFTIRGVLWCFGNSPISSFNLSEILTRMCLVDIVRAGLTFLLYEVVPSLEFSLDP